jgi:hypothetical protein
MNVYVVMRELGAGWDVLGVYETEARAEMAAYKYNKEDSGAFVVQYEVE